MAKLINPTYFIGGNEIASNSLDVDYGDPISVKAGYASKAVAGDKIDGISVETKTFEADNVTEEKAKLEFARLGDESVVEFTVEGWTIAQGNVGSTYDLNASSNVNGATVAAVAQISTLTPANVEIGDIFTATINSVDIQFVATATTVANVTAWLTAAINLSAENWVVTAVDWTTLITITSDVAWTAFTLTGTATNGWGNDTQTLTAATWTANVAAVAQVDTVTLTGTSGTAVMSGVGGLSEPITFALAWTTDLTQTAADFVTTSAADYAVVGITVTSSAATIIFTAAVAWTAHAAPVVTNATGDLAGTNAATTANVAAVAQISTATPALVEIGDTFTATLNGTAVAFVATAATVANVTAGLTAAINLSAQAGVLTAVDSTTTVTITSDAAWTAFTITCAATAWGWDDTQSLTAATGTANVSAGTPTQLTLRKVKSTTLWDFVRAK